MTTTVKQAVDLGTTVLPAQGGETIDLGAGGDGAGLLTTTQLQLLLKLQLKVHLLLVLKEEIMKVLLDMVLLSLLVQKVVLLMDKLLIWVPLMDKPLI